MIPRNPEQRMAAAVLGQLDGDAGAEPCEGGPPQGAFTPALREHRDFVFERHLGLPMDL